jgi:hypothetical protein
MKKEEGKKKVEEACPAFGKGYDAEVEECQLCEKGFPEEFKTCKELTLGQKKAEKKVDKKIEKNVEKKVDKKIEKNVEKKVEKKADKRTEKEWIVVSKTKKDWETIITEKYPRRGAHYIKVLKGLSKKPMTTAELVKVYGRQLGWGERIWIAQNAVKLYKKDGKWMVEL